MAFLVYTMSHKKGRHYTCVPVHSFVVTQRSRQTPTIWQVTTVDSEVPNGSSNR